MMKVIKKILCQFKITYFFIKCNATISIFNICDVNSVISQILLSLILT
jgi:hypothetical protein